MVHMHQELCIRQHHGRHSLRCIPQASVHPLSTALPQLMYYTSCHGEILQFLQKGQVVQTPTPNPNTTQPTTKTGARRTVSPSATVAGCCTECNAPNPTTVHLAQAWLSATLQYTQCIPFKRGAPDLNSTMQCTWCPLTATYALHAPKQANECMRLASRSLPVHGIMPMLHIAKAGSAALCGVKFHALANFPWHNLCALTHAIKRPQQPRRPGLQHLYTPPVTTCTTRG